MSDNEYQDQARWWEVQHQWNGRWICISDHDTDLEAEKVAERLFQTCPSERYRVVRVHGLPE